MKMQSNTVFIIGGGFGYRTRTGRSVSQAGEPGHHCGPPRVINNAGTQREHDFTHGETVSDDVVEQGIDANLLGLIRVSAAPCPPTKMEMLLW